MAGQPGAHGEVEGRVCAGKGGVESIERGEHRTPHQHAAGRDAQMIGLDVVLRLVEFPVNERHRTTVGGECLTEAGDHVRFVEPHELRTGNRHRGSDLNGPE